jgi:hypothetical protein
MPIIHSGAAQMIVPGPETSPGFAPGVWLLHNTSPTTEVYFSSTQNVHPIAGTTSYVIPPGATISLTGYQTFWARTADGTTADLHVVPTAPFSVPAPASPVTGALNPLSLSAG